MAMTKDAPRGQPTPNDDLKVTGAHRLEKPLDPQAAAALLARIRSLRAFDDSLFLDESDFDADPQYRGVNPRPGRNLLEAFEPELAFVEQDPDLVAALTAILGAGYIVRDRKVVCGVPARFIPPWLKARIEGAPVNNLGPYVRPEYRDATYFYGIDFHQDIIDFRDQDADFLTLYVYLHPVGRDDAPLFLLEGSHRLGADTFPHDLKRSGDGWRFTSDSGDSLEVSQSVLTGQAGFAALWHPFTLHGTQPDAADHERISLRYLVARTAPGRVGLDEINDAIRGPLSLQTTRIDLAENGAARIKVNTVRSA